MKNYAKVLSFGWLGRKKIFELSIANYPYVMEQRISDAHGLCIAICIYHKDDYARIEHADPKHPHFLLVFDTQFPIHRIRTCSAKKEDYFPTYDKYYEYCKKHDACPVSHKDYEFFEENAGIQSILLLIVETLPELFYNSVPEN